MVFSSPYCIGGLCRGWGVLAEKLKKDQERPWEAKGWNQILNVGSKEWMSISLNCSWCYEKILISAWSGEGWMGEDTSLCELPGLQPDSLYCAASVLLACDDVTVCTTVFYQSKRSSVARLSGPQLFPPILSYQEASCPEPRLRKSQKAALKSWQSK